jgi:S-(hydroxymethyl)glutathione dehydrogenase / alcohol dehydrogenase
LSGIHAQAAITDGCGNLFIDEIEVVDPGPGEVLVEIKAAGVCQTDYLYLRRGIRRILGHEGAGIVLRIGPDVRHLREGDRVVLNWATACGECFQCVRGNLSICENRRRPSHGSSRYRGEHIERAFYIGTMSTHALVAAAAATRLEDGIEFVPASILGCCVATGYGSVVKAAKVTPGSSVVVIGTGAVGLNIMQAARIAGAYPTIAVDVNPLKLEFALKFGATKTILADRQDIELRKAAEEVKLMTGGRGADFAFEATGVPALGAAPLAMVRNAGTAIQASGIEEELTIDMRLFEWDKTYINPRYGMCNPNIDFPVLMSLYQRGTLLLDELVTRTYRLDELPRAFDDMINGRNTKGVLVL